MGILVPDTPLSLTYMYVALGPLAFALIAVPMFVISYKKKLTAAQSVFTRRPADPPCRPDPGSAGHQESVPATEASFGNVALAMLSTTLNMRVPYVRTHSLRVAEFSTVVAHALKLSETQIRDIKRASLLHDIGKIGVPEEILLKPTCLSPNEYDRVKRHAGIGADILQSAYGLGHLAPIIRHHHERWDGQGYPDGLSGNDIPIESRIIAVCDAAEVMGSARPYKLGMSQRAIVAELERCAGFQFDPAIVATFIHQLDQKTIMVSHDNGYAQVIVSDQVTPTRICAGNGNRLPQAS